MPGLSRICLQHKRNKTGIDKGRVWYYNKEQILHKAMKEESNCSKCGFQGVSGMTGNGRRRRYNEVPSRAAALKNIFSRRRRTSSVTGIGYILYLKKVRHFCAECGWYRGTVCLSSLFVDERLFLCFLRRTNSKTHTWIKERQDYDYYYEAGRNARTC